MPVQQYNTTTSRVLQQRPATGLAAFMRALSGGVLQQLRGRHDTRLDLHEVAAALCLAAWRRLMRFLIGSSLLGGVSSIHRTTVEV